MVRRVILFFIASGFLFLACKKKDQSTDTFVISAKQTSGTKVTISWSAQHLTGFKHYSVYRSNEPIPEPSFSLGIDQNLLIASISDADVNSYIDSNLTVGSFGSKVYYRVVIDLNDRFIYSNQESASFDAFSVNLLSNGSSFSQYFSKTFPEINMIYFFNYSQGILSAVSYSEKKVKASATVSSSSSGVLIATGINSGNPEVFVYNYSNYLVTCYNAYTLQQKYSFSVAQNYSLRTILIRNNYLYAIDENYNIPNLYVYDLNARTLVNQMQISTYLPINNGYIEGTPDIYLGTQTNNLYIKAAVQHYNYNISMYTYVNYISVYSLANNIPSFINNLNIPAANSYPDTLSSSNYNLLYYMQVSPDGKYISCNLQGDIYSTSDFSIHNILTSTDISPLPVFSNDGQYLIGRNSNSSFGSNSLDIFSLPSFAKKTTITSPNLASNSGTFLIASDFMDNDTLISYNLQRTFVQSSEVDKVTLFYNKIN